MNTQNHPSSSVIRRVLDANAVFSATSGLFFWVAAQPLAAFLGASELFIRVLTAVMFGYAALIAFNTSRPSVHRNFVLFTVLADSTWVLASILLLTTGWISFSVDAKWAIGITAVAVDVFATLQFLEWRKMN